MPASDLHPIQIAARRSGLKVDTIRAWERRYKAIKPKRGKNQRRLYRDEDIERLRLLARATQSGRRISDLAALPTARIAEMVADDAQAIQQLPADAPHRPRTEAIMEYFDSCLEALEKLDSLALSHVLHVAQRSLAEPSMAEELILPLLQHIREECRVNHMRLAHEQMAWQVARAHLTHYICPPEIETEALPRAVVAGLFGQSEELPLLRLAVAARAYGWHPLYLGTNLTTDEVTWASAHSGALCTLVCAAAHNPDLLPNELRKMRRHMSEDYPILLFGGDATLFRPVIEEEKIVPVTELTSLRTVLNRIRAAPVNAAAA